MCCAIITNYSRFFYNPINKATKFYILEISLIKVSLSFKYFDLNIYQGQNINLWKWKGCHLSSQGNRITLHGLCSIVPYSC